MPKHRERKSSFELSALIHHMDSRDFHAWNVGISLSTALKSRQPALAGAEHEKTERNRKLISAPAIITLIPSEPEVHEQSWAAHELSNQC